MRGAYAHGKSLQALRQARGLTQEELAVLAELDVKTIRNAEQGKRLDLGTLSRLAYALETELKRVIQPGRSEAELQIRRRDVILAWYRAWDAQDNETVLGLYHDRAVLRLPGSPSIPSAGTFQGKDQIRQANELFWSLCRTDPIPAKAFSLIASDNKVVLQDTKGVNRPSGELVRFDCVHVMTFEDDLILEHVVHYDTLQFTQMLGVPPKTTTT